MTRQEYIQKFRGVVIGAVKGTGLYPSVMMAQAILESSDKKGVPGNSSLAKVYNNHFGIKADKSWAGKKVNMKTREVFDGKDVIIGDYFRVYEDALQSFKDRIQFLLKNKRYFNAGVFKSPTPEQQADALQAAGYATDPNYAKVIKGLIANLNLKDLDAECSHV
jgi:flagellum-specific peptidoglycan hydrolase FlgJ